TGTFWQSMKPYSRRLVTALAELARSKGNADWLLHALKDARRHLGLMSFRRAVDDPYFGTGASQIIAHLLEARAIEKSGDRDEADDTLLVLVGITGGSVIA